MIHALMMIAHRGSDAVIEADADEAEEQSERLACRHLVAQDRNAAIIGGSVVGDRGGKADGQVGGGCGFGDPFTPIGMDFAREIYSPTFHIFNSLAIT